MKKNAINVCIIAALSCSVILSGCSKTGKSDVMGTDVTLEEYKAAAVENSAAAKVLAENVKYKDIENTDDKCVVKFDGSNAEISSDKASLEDNVLSVNSAGTYEFSGDFSGTVSINASDEDVVYIILNGVNVISETYSPFVVENADKVIIYINENTTNSFTDGENYELPDGMTEDELPNAVIYSECDLGFSGSGKLTVNARCNDGIKSKKDIWFNSGEYEIFSADDGIVGKKSVSVKSGSFTIDSEGDGIKTTEEDDAEKGFISIADGTFNISSGNDGIQAETYLYIEDGDYDITTASGSAAAVKKNAIMDFGQKREFSESTPAGVEREPGESTSAGVDREPGERNGDNKFDKPKEVSGTAGRFSEENLSDESESESCKALKAGKDITILGGDFNIDSKDDSFHSNSTMSINAGKMNISSGDDGFHADEVLVISEADVVISNSYEGIEADVIVIEGGNIDITSTDDGINAANGNSTGSMDPNDTSNSTSVLYITGGTMVVNADGDGIDSNGTITMTGGNVIVYGPENDGNGFFDYDISFVVTGGELMAAGSSGMLQSLSDETKQAGLAVVFDSSYDAQTEVVLKDSAGNTISSITPPKKFNAVMFSNSELKEKEKYEIYVNGESIKEIELSSVNVIDGYEGMGGGINKGNMQMPDGEMPQKPNGEMPQMPDGEMPQKPDGEMPQKPDGEMPQESDSDKTNNTNKKSL